MKKIILGLAFCFVFSFAAEAQKLGYMNSKALMTVMPEMKAADAELTTFAQQLQKQGEQMVANFQKKYQDLEQQIAEGKLSPKQQQEEAQKFQVEQEQITLFEQEMNLKIQKKEAELLQPIVAKVTEAINAVAAEHGYIMILDQSTSAVLHGDTANDVFDLVKAKLGL